MRARRLLSGSGLRIVAGSALLAALSLLFAHAPGYDPWAWLIWGREVAGGGLDTVDGPAFKPLPVAVDALLWLAFGDGGAPDAWLLVARTGALAGVALAARFSWRMTQRCKRGQTPNTRGAPALAAGLAGLGVALTAGYAFHGAVGNAEGLALAGLVLAVGGALDGRPRLALLAGAGVALLRPEAWPILLAYAVWVGRGDRALRPWLALGGVAILAAWFVPEWLGSGDPLRSGDRARVPNPGQPATADVPGLRSLEVALGLPLLPLLLGAPAAPGRARWPAAIGGVWIAEVALMAQLLGTSGEPRYAVPGAALIAISGAVGLTRLVTTSPSARDHAPGAGSWARGALVVVLVGVAVSAAVRGDGTRAELRRAADDAALWSSLPAAIAGAGGAAGVLACGPPTTGRFRGTGVAWALGVPKQRVQTPQGGGGAVLRSRIRPGAPVQPAAPAGARTLGRSARWSIAC